LGCVPADDAPANRVIVSDNRVIVLGNRVIAPSCKGMLRIILDNLIAITY
jgi:hypothetical protein